MRADAKVLLERLGKSDFRYREFVDRFADLESWPIFEALLKDPRIMPQEEPPAMRSGRTGRQPATAGARAPSRASSRLPSRALCRWVNPKGGARSPAAPSLFGRYGRPERAQNIRSLLQRLSDAVEGEMPDGPDPVPQPAWRHRHFVPGGYHRHCPVARRARCHGARPGAARHAATAFRHRPERDAAALDAPADEAASASVQGVALRSAAAMVRQPDFAEALASGEIGFGGDQVFVADIASGDRHLRDLLLPYATLEICPLTATAECLMMLPAVNDGPGQDLLRDEHGGGYPPLCPPFGGLPARIAGRSPARPGAPR
jgi:hypothetical protein